MSEDMAKETPVEELQQDMENITQVDVPVEKENPMDNIAYFVIFPQNTKVLDEAVAIIPNEVARKAVLDAINSVLIPVTKEQIEEAQKGLEQSAPSE